MNVCLCNDICNPSWDNDLCHRCITQQYENIIEEIDDCECFDDYLYFDDEEDYYQTDFY